jgi:hypothetical protein
MEICRELFLILEPQEKGQLQRFVSGDESRLTLEFRHSTRWSVVRNDVPQKAKHQIAIQKFTLTVIWGIDGFHIVSPMTEQHS